MMLNMPFSRSLPEWRDSGNRQPLVARILEMLAFINRRRAENVGIAVMIGLPRAGLPALFGAAESIRHRYDAAVRARPSALHATPQSPP